MSAEDAIWADSLTKTYRSGGTTVTVFKGLSIRVPKGERVAIMGESGAGKSTLLHLLGGLERPDEGRIWYDGRDITKLGEREVSEFRNSTVGFVWQNPSLLPEFSALENVSMPLLIRGAAKDKAKNVAVSCLREVGLESRAGHLAGELSGGEQQRIGLARALAGSPKVLLADEPTGSLDFRTAEAITALLRAVHDSHGLTSIFVTHNHSFAQQCDRVLELRKGNLQNLTDMELQGAEVFQDATRLGGGTYV
ncbi:MAG: ABC transporter ATP-binding protein [Bryobacteraceae bacterium]